MSRKERAVDPPVMAPAATPDALAALEAFRKEHHAKGFEEGWKAAQHAVVVALGMMPVPLTASAQVQVGIDLGPIPEKVKQPTPAEAREQGRQHAQDGYSRTLCPYFRGSKLAAAWDEGWVEGEVRG